MAKLFYFRLLTDILLNFLGKFDFPKLCGDIESNPGPGLIPIKASQFATRILKHSVL